MGIYLEFNLYSVYNYVSSKLHSLNAYLMVFSYIVKLFTKVFDVNVDLLKASLAIVDYYINNVNQVLLQK